MLPTTLAPGSYVSKAMKAELDFKGALAKGAKGIQVTRVQEHLCLAGFSLSIDGDFGSTTFAQVGAFQTARGLPATGTVDQATHAALVAPMVRAVAPLPANGKALSDLVADYALQHIAQGAREAGGDNMGPWVRAYLGWQGRDARWCAGFTCYALEQAAFTLGVKAPIASSASCDMLAASAKAAGKFVKEGATTPAKIKRGSFFLVRATATDWVHVGIVTGTRPDLILTAEGNTNNQGSSNGYEATTRARNYNSKDFIVW